MSEFSPDTLTKPYRSEVSVTFGQLMAAIQDAEPNPFDNDGNMASLVRIKAAYRRYCAATKARTGS